jgi:Holliday junction DNA helicase RuvA
MIAGLKGTIEALGSNWVIIAVGGISFQVFLPTSTLSTLGSVGREVKLFTHLAVREDNLSLYGFGSARELSLFQTVTTVKGIGPKIGMAMLSAMEADQLSMAIASGDATLLTSIPGIGLKTASRIILELKDKVGGGWMVTQDMDSVQSNGDVVSALTSLGYSVAEAARAVGALPPDKKLTLEEKVTIALKSFGGK